MLCSYCQPHFKCAWEADGRRLPRICPIPPDVVAATSSASVDLHSFRGTYSDAAGTTLLVTTHFNPCGYRRLRQTYYEWADTLGELQKHLVCVELVLDDDSPEITGSVVLRGTRRKHVLWQKEAMLNYALRKLTRGKKYFCWLDHDLVLGQDDWLSTAVGLLEQGNTAVQLFSHVSFLNESRQVTATRPGAVFALHTTGKANGSPGGAWLAKTATIKKMGGLFDYHIVGAGDQLTFDAMCGTSTNAQVPQSANSHKLSDEWVATARRKVSKVSAAYLDATCYHLFHGTRSRRQYIARHAELVRTDFNPLTELTRTADGMLEWRNPDSEVVKHVHDYFLGRDEDNTT